MSSHPLIRSPLILTNPSRDIQLQKHREEREKIGVWDPPSRRLEKVLGCRRNLGSMASKWNITYFKNVIYWGYNPFTNHLLTSWDIQVWLEDFGRLCKGWGSLAKIDLVGGFKFQPMEYYCSQIGELETPARVERWKRWTYKNDWKPPTSNYLLLDFEDSGGPISSSFRIGKCIFPHDHCCSPNITGFFCHQQPVVSPTEHSQNKKYVPSNEGVYSLLGGSSHDLQVVNNHGDRFRTPRPGGLFPFQMAVSFIKAPVNGGDPITMQKNKSWDDPPSIRLLKYHMSRL